MALQNKKQMYGSANSFTNHIQTKAETSELTKPKGFRHQARKPNISVWFGDETVNHLSISRSKALNNITMFFAYP